MHVTDPYQYPQPGDQQYPGQQPGYPQGQPAYPAQQPGYPQGGYSAPPAYPAAQGYPAQQSYPAQPVGSAGAAAIALTLKWFPLAWIFGLLKPKVVIDGVEQRLPWGRHVIPVQPGQHHLHVHVPYFLPKQFGKADLPLVLGPGQMAEVEYRTPLYVFQRGALGPAPQKYPGMVAFWIFLGLAVLLCGCQVLSAIVQAGTGS